MRNDLQLLICVVLPWRVQVPTWWPYRKIHKLTHRVSGPFFEISLLHKSRYAGSLDISRKHVTWKAEAGTNLKKGNLQEIKQNSRKEVPQNLSWTSREISSAATKQEQDTIKQKQENRHKMFWKLKTIHQEPWEDKVNCLCKQIKN